MVEVIIAPKSSNALLNFEFREGNIDMLSLNHSYICLKILKQLIANENIEPLPELTLDIANSLTPNISVFQKTKIQPQSVPEKNQLAQSRTATAI